MAARASARSASDFDVSSGSRAGSVPWHTGRVSTPDTRAESVPLTHWPSKYPRHTGRISSLAHGPCQYPSGSRAGSVPWQTGRVSAPGTRAGSVPLAHGPGQYPWHTGRISAPGTRAESVPNPQQSKHALNQCCARPITRARSRISHKGQSRSCGPVAASTALARPVTRVRPGAVSATIASPALAGP